MSNYGVLRFLVDCLQYAAIVGIISAIVLGIIDGFREVYTNVK